MKQAPQSKLGQLFIGEEGESTSGSGSGAGEAPDAGTAEAAAQPAGSGRSIGCDGRGIG